MDTGVFHPSILLPNKPGFFNTPWRMYGLVKPVSGITPKEENKYNADPNIRDFATDDPLIFGSNDLNIETFPTAPLIQLPAGRFSRS